MLRFNVNSFEICIQCSVYCHVAQFDEIFVFDLHSKQCRSSSGFLRSQLIWICMAHFTVWLFLVVVVVFQKLVPLYFSPNGTMAKTWHGNHPLKCDRQNLRIFLFFIFLFIIFFKNEVLFLMLILWPLFYFLIKKYPSLPSCRLFSPSFQVTKRTFQNKYGKKYHKKDAWAGLSENTLLPEAVKERQIA